MHLIENGTETYFVRATVDPKTDLRRNFSCVNNAFVDRQDEITDAIGDIYPDGSDHLRPPRQDPVTGGWCWEPEAGLSSFAVQDAVSFQQAMRAVRGYASHLGQVGVFASSDFDLGAGSDGEDVFRDGRFVGWLDLDASYDEFRALTQRPLTESASLRRTV